MPVLEALALKGLIVIGKAIATKAAVAKGAVAIYHAVGLANAIAAASVVGVVVGGIYWTKERVDNLLNGLKALDDGDISKAAINLGRLAISSDIEVKMLPDAVHDYLIKARVPEEKAQEVSKVVSGMEDKIVEQVRRLK